MRPSLISPSFLSGSELVHPGPCSTAREVIEIQLAMLDGKRRRGYLRRTLWIIVHRDLRRSACVRAVIDWVKALFAEQRDVIAGNR